MNPAIGLVIALTAEARALIGRGRWQHAEGHLFRRSRLNNRTPLVLVRSGLGMENALSASQWLIKQDVAALGSLGVSGGLDSRLKAGAVVLADSVFQQKGNCCEEVCEGDSKFVEMALAALIARRIPAYQGPIITVQKPVLSARNKQALFTKTKALAVDMESAAVAHAGKEADLPFFALRTVCDAATRSIPIGIYDCLNQAGHLRLPHLFRMLLLRPSMVFDLLRTRKDFAAALSTLRRVWPTQISSSLSALLKSGDP